MKKTISILLILGMLCLTLAGCGGQAAPEIPAETDAVLGNALPQTTDLPETETEAPETEAPETEAPENDGEVEGEIVLENVSFVMIYDPYIYDETNEQQNLITTLYSGDMGRQIVTGLVRAGELSEDDVERPVKVSQADVNAGVDIGSVERAGGRAGGADPVYQLGSTHEFFHHDSRMQTRIKEEFVCVYAGESCYIWALDGSIDENDAAEIGQEFDQTIFPNDKSYFGTPRFTDNGGKVNVLFYPLPEGLCGFFYLGDIFSSQEAPKDLSEAYGLNTDHAIINVNSNMVESDKRMVEATLAHELQHQICATESFYFSDSPVMRTWLNEAMSACAEELSYPGIMEEYHYNECFYLSDNFRKGQSLYNFDTKDDKCIGAYGIVYLFQKYLSQNAGDGVFGDIHSYWRDSYSATVNEAEAIYASLPETFIDRIDGAYTFPEGIASGFSSPEEEWMSKMTLDFYLETVRLELAGLTEYANQAHLLMLYAEVNPLDIQGGGRVIVATENGSFTIPEDAGKGLIFIGFDSNFQVVTEIYSNVG